MTSTAVLKDATIKRLQKVQTQIRNGELRQAAEGLNAASAADPADPRIYLLGIQLAEAAGQPARAEQCARRALELAPEWPPAVTELALLLARQNQFQQAIEYARKAVAIAADSPEVLGQAIAIAHRAQHLELAKQWLARAIALAPDDLNLRRDLARDLRSTGEHEKAVAGYDELLARNPADRLALLGRAQTFLDMGRRDAAMADTAALLQIDPSNEEYQYWNDVAQGLTPRRQPPAMVRDMFDHMADVYDNHVVAGLKYKLPREVARKIKELHPAKLNVLDLGCGTGLLGACLGRIDGALIGVELSTRMIEQAARHGVYDRFHTVDLLDALKETPASLYDVIAALDVLIYVGDISAAIPDAYRVLREGGHFIFSCETAGEDEADMVLRPTQRYAHKASHVEAMCRAAGFEEVTLERMPLRYENAEQVQGFLVTARKPA